MIHSLLSSLRARLLLLVVIAAVPVFGLTLYTGLMYRQQEVVEAQDEALRVVRLASFYQSRAIDSTRQLLITLSRLPDVQPINPESCSALLSDLLKQHTFYANFGVAQVDGKVTCSALPMTGPVNIADRGYFQDALANRDFAIGSYQIGRISGKPALNVGYPLLDSGGVAQGVIFAALDLAWFNQLVAEAQLPPGSTVTLIDREGVILARSPDPDVWIGKSLPETPLVQKIHSEHEGTAELTGLDGVSRLYGFTALNGSVGDAHVTVGIPAELAYAEADGMIAQNLLGLSVVFALVLVATWIVSNRFVVHSVGVLVGAAQKLREGDFSPRVGLLDGPREMQQLGSAFDEMAGALQIREAEAEKMQEYLTRYAARLDLLHGLDQTILASRSAAEAAKVALMGLQELVSCHRASVALFDLQAHKARILSTSSGSPFPEGTDVHVDISTVQKELLRGEMRVVEDLEALPQRTPTEQLLLERGARAYHLLPLMLRGELIGTLNLILDRPGTFSPDEIEVAQEVAAQLVIAVQNTRQDEQIQQHVDELEQRVEERTADLKRSKEHVEAILNSSGDAIILARAKGQIEQVNAAFYRLFGHNGAEMYGKPMAGLVEGDGLEAFQAALEMVTLTKQTARLELALRRENGTSFTGDLTITRVSERDTKEAKVICSVRDISARKQAEDALRAYAEQIRDLYDRAPCGYHSLDEDGVFVQINETELAWLGYTWEEVVGKKNILNLMTPASQEIFRREFPAFKTRGWVRDLEFDLIRKDGTILPVILNATAITDPDGHFVMSRTTTFDITERKRLEDELRRALETEKGLNEFKSRFVSMLSHDFRNPLAVIQSSSGLLRDYRDRLGEDKKLAHIEKIQIQVKRLVEMLDDMLTLMKAQTVGTKSSPKPLDVTTFCQNLAKEIQQTVATTHQVEFSSSGCGTALLDEKLLRQIVTNLLSNAVKYSPQGGTVKFSLNCGNGKIVLKIEDTGIGIPAQDQARLFEAFQRARNVGDIGGTGLGLAIVKQAVDAHGGSISFESEVGIGTTFVVTLPAAP